MITDFRHTCILVSDFKKAIRFYRDLLGLKVEKTRVVAGPDAARTFHKKAVSLEYAKLSPPGWPQGRPAPFELHCWHFPKLRPKKECGHVSFTVEDMDRTYKRLRARGVRFLSGPSCMPSGKSKLCFACDPDGNLIEFIEDIKRK